MDRRQGTRSELAVAEGALVALLVCAGLLSLGWVTILIWALVATWVFFDARHVGRAPLASALAAFLLPGFGVAFYVRNRRASSQAVGRSASGRS